MIQKNDLLNFFSNTANIPNIALNLFIIDNNDEIKKIQIDKDTSIKLLGEYSIIAKSYLEGESISIKNIDEYNDWLVNTYYEFREDQLTPEMKFIRHVPLSTQNFFSVDDIKSIKWIIIKIGNESKFCNLYIPYYPIFALNREKWAVLVPEHKQFKSLDANKILRFNTKIVFLYYKLGLEDEITLTLDIPQIEKSFWYEKEFIKKANSRVDQIDKLSFVANIDQFREYIEKKTSIRNKIIRIPENSLVFTKTIDQIKGFVKTKKYLDIFQYQDDKFLIDSEKKARTFLKILDDDFLKSELTEWEYDSDIKTHLVKQ